MMPGNLFEDLPLGAIFTHSAGRTVTESDIVWFSLLTMNQHPVHVDAHSAVASEHETLLAPATLVVSIVLGLSVADVSWNATVNLSWDEVEFLGPVHAGDSLRAFTEIVGADGQTGVVTCATTGVNQEKTPVVRVRRRIQVRSRRAAE